jgi:hypothetical protein
LIEISLTKIKSTKVKQAKREKGTHKIKGKGKLKDSEKKEGLTPFIYVQGSCLEG